ncbi:MAG: ABC transporter ATP-binding protein [Flavobacteriia bacterium]|nr:ABC transporter ATP-binding protein [Flavobacteriia bacterium]
MTVVLKVEKISKQYRLGEVSRKSFIEDVKKIWYKILKKDNPFLNIGEENDKSKISDCNYVWSLRDISFELNKGDVLGVIGLNGAGKSTLLKILSRVTAPTLGSIKANGRIASLLEVGTGFHPELTGKENIFLNGAILGMKKNEINEKLNEIVEFAGIEKYIDTPVKRYSSGMYVRLAFAVAAHLESDILIVDEVLAVGDADFQKKCLGKLKEISNENGRTILFVSHNIAAIQQLCNKGILLENGKLIFSGDIKEVVSHYTESHKIETQTKLSEIIKRSGTKELVFTDFFLIDTNSNEKLLFIVSGQDVTFRFILNKCSKETFKSVFFGIGINDNYENRIIHLDNDLIGVNFENINNIEYVDFIVPNLSLVEGFYSLAIICKVNLEISDWIQLGVGFEVQNGDYYKTGKSIDKTAGKVYLPFNIKLKTNEI